MKFNSIIHLLDQFQDEETCLEYYEKLRWNGNPTCPFCSAEKPYITNRGFKCRNNKCHKKFTVKVGTIFENSKIPMRTWFIAIYLCTTAKKGVSSLQLANQLNVTQKTAWFMWHRIREMLRDKSPKLLGKTEPVEIDEAYIGGKEGNKHKGKKRSAENPELTNEGKPYKPKQAVIGLVERNGNIILKCVDSASVKALIPTIKESVYSGAIIYTDEYNAYKSLKNRFTHQTVNHSSGVYVVGEVHTNTIENFWSLLKRGIYGMYHFVSDKHLNRYLDEFSARYNTRSIANDERFEKFMEQSQSRLSYKTLVA